MDPDPNPNPNNPNNLLDTIILYYNVGVSKFISTIDKLINMPYHSWKSKLNVQHLEC